MLLAIEYAYDFEEAIGKQSDQYRHRSTRSEEAQSRICVQEQVQFEDL